MLVLVPGLGARRKGVRVAAREIIGTAHDIQRLLGPTMVLSMCSRGTHASLLTVLSTSSCRPIKDTYRLHTCTPSASIEAIVRLS